MRDLMFTVNQGGDHVQPRNEPGYGCKHEEKIITVDDRRIREVSGVEFSPFALPLPQRHKEQAAGEWVRSFQEEETAKQTKIKQEILQAESGTECGAVKLFNEYWEGVKIDKER